MAKRTKKTTVETEQKEAPAEGRRQTKDHVFTDLFAQKEYQKLLFKVLHPELPDLKDSELETLTLQTVLDRGVYNDLGFVARDRMLVLVEAQTTFSLNMPYRALMYLAKTYYKYAKLHSISLYGPKKAEMPAPELYMIYTGERGNLPDVLSFRETFFKGRKCDIDIKIKVIYADGSHNIVDQYIVFCRVFDEQRKLYPDNLHKAIQETVRICKDKDILKKYLEKHESEVIDMMEALFSQDEVTEMAKAEIAKESKAEGIGIGEVIGEKKGEVKTFWSLIQDKIITKVNAAKRMGISVAQFDKLCKEYAFA